MKTIFIDLDGPIINASDRYYTVYSDFLIKIGIKPLSKKEYWDSKRSGVSEEEIFKRSKCLFPYVLYNEERKKQLEADRYLLLDSLQPQADQTLKRLNEKHTIVIITIRKSLIKIKTELMRFTITDYISDILCRELYHQNNMKENWEIKYYLLKKYLEDHNVQISHAMIVGDSEADILSGKKLGIQTVGVTNGIRKGEIVEKLQADIILDTISELVTI